MEGGVLFSRPSDFTVCQFLLRSGFDSFPAVSSDFLKVVVGFQSKDSMRGVGMRRV